MKKHYLSVFALALFAATASAQFTTKEQAKAHIEALRVANTEAADDAISAVNAASSEAGYNDAVKDFYHAIDGSKVYFTNSARGGGKNYLTVSSAFVAAGDHTETPTAENVFELEYDEPNNAFALRHAVTGRALTNLPKTNNTFVPTVENEGGLYTLTATEKNNTFSLLNKATAAPYNHIHLANDKSGAQYNIVRWSAGNGELNDGSTWSLESAESVTEEAIYEAALSRIVSWNLHNNTFGSALGQRYASQKILDIWKKVGNGKGTIDDLQTLISAYADKTSLTLNMPQRGDFFRIKSKDGSHYITTKNATAGEWQLQTTTDAPDENTIFCFDGEHLVSLKTGRALYLKGNSRAKLAAYDVATPATVEFGELADGKYKVVLKQGNQKATVHLWQDNRDYVDGWGGDNTKDNLTHLQLEEVEKVPVQLNAKGLASFCAPYYMVVPANVEIYVASAFNAAKDRIILTQLSGNIIPEGTAVVLKGAASTKIELTYAEGEMTVTPPAVNLFQGKATPSQIAAGQEARALKGDEFLVLSTPYVRGLRAYLSSAAGGATRSQLAFPGVTGVERVATAENAEAPIFDLSGRRVEKPVAGQIYVQNGQKFLQR